VTEQIRAGIADGSLQPDEAGNYTVTVDGITVTTKLSG